MELTSARYQRIAHVGYGVLLIRRVSVKDPLQKWVHCSTLSIPRFMAHCLHLAVHSTRSLLCGGAGVHANYSGKAALHSHVSAVTSPCMKRKTGILNAKSAGRSW